MKIAFFTILSLVAIDVWSQNNEHKDLQPVRSLENLEYHYSEEKEHFQNRFESPKKLQYRAYQTHYKSTNQAIRLDSITGPEYRRQFTYDNMNRLISDVYNNFNYPANSWDPHFKWTYEYSNNGFRTTETFYRWNVSTKSWGEEYLLVTEQDIKENLTLDEYSRWNLETNSWEGFTKNTYTFDDDNNMQSSIYFHWSDTDWDWIKEQKTEYTYNSEGQNTIKKYYDWVNNNDWHISNEYKYFYNDAGKIAIDSSFSYFYSSTPQLYSLVLYTYDNTGRLLVKNRFSEESINGDLILTDSTCYQYLDNGLSNIEYYYNYNSDSLSWELYRKEKNRYNQNGNQTLYENYFLNRETGNLEGSSKYEREFDNHGNVITSKSYNWLVSDTIWNGNFGYIYTYDYNYLAKDILVPYVGSNEIHKTISSTPLEFVDGEWLEMETRTYHYSGNILLAIDALNQFQLDVLPNPANNFINFEGLEAGASIRILNTNGNIILESDISENQQLSVSELPVGVYFYQITNDGTNSTGKLLINR